MLFGFDLQGWITVVAGVLLALITLFTGYDHVDLFGRVTVRINQQIGVFILLAPLATLVVVDAVLSEGVAQLASRRRNRDSNDRAREADSEAEERERAARRAQRQDR